MKKNDMKAAAFDVIYEALGNWILDEGNHTMGVYWIDGVLAMAQTIVDDMEGGS